MRRFWLLTCACAPAGPQCFPEAERYSFSSHVLYFLTSCLPPLQTNSAWVAFDKYWKISQAVLDHFAHTVLYIKPFFSAPFDFKARTDKKNKQKKTEEEQKLCVLTLDRMFTRGICSFTPQKNFAPVFWNLTLACAQMLLCGFLIIFSLTVMWRFTLFASLAWQSTNKMLSRCNNCVCLTTNRALN